MTIAMTATLHPEEIECFRMPMPDGRFSRDKRYEYTYAARKSWEYIPALRRKDWRYFTNKEFTYAGKWLRSQQRGQGDGGDYWEVFLDDRADGGGGGGGGMKDKIVSWDYDGTLCWRECPYGHGVHDELITGITRQVMDEMITTIVEKTPRISKEIDTPPISLRAASEAKTNDEWSLIRWLFGCPSKCGLLDCAETTTMEAKYRVHNKIAEFWCFVTSIFYGSSLLLYLVKEEDWFEGWRAPATLDGWPTYIHFSIAISVLVMICSAVYHISLLEVLGCVDCFLASFIFASVTMTTFGVDILTQIGVLLTIGVLNLYAWRYSTRIALIVVALIYPFAMLSCSNMKSYYGGVVFTLISTGVACFILDRMGVAPLHSLWHILGGGAITLSLYYVIVNGVLE